MLNPRKARSEAARIYCVDMMSERPYDNLIKDVADAYGVSVKDILSRKRPERIAFPRQVAMYLCHHVLHDTFHQIGRTFRRDHGTVLHAVKRINSLPPHSRSKRDVMTLLAKVLQEHVSMRLGLPSGDHL